MTWLGLVLVVVAAHTLTLADWNAVLPVAGTALVIIGGTSVPKWGVERLLALRPLRAVGRWSYGLYLWEIPVLLLVGHGWGSIGRISLLGRVGFILVTVVIAAASFAIYETPIRRSPRLVASPGLSLACALAFIIGSLVTISLVAR
jgi:peptidoglycan/LPS O-acetylase OafA/YrhL